MATLYPALAIGRADTIGRLASGLPENWILFDGSLQLITG
jgi:N-acetylglucosamine-6-phosphate deacetylase